MWVPVWLFRSRLLKLTLLPFCRLSTVVWVKAWDWGQTAVSPVSGRLMSMSVMGKSILKFTVFAWELLL